MASISAVLGTLGCALFIVSIDTEPEKRDDAEAAALECLEAIVREGVTDDEVKKVMDSTI